MIVLVNFETNLKIYDYIFRFIRIIIQYLYCILVNSFLQTFLHCDSAFRISYKDLPNQQ